MPRLLVQADDNGLSRGVALGVAESIRRGIVRNTGLFTNMPATAYAVDLLDGLDGIAIGIDFNFVTGRPLSDPRDVRALVDDDGAFPTSGQRLASGVVTGTVGLVTQFADDPFPVDQLELEARAQLDEFVRLVGRAPDYAHFHSLTTPHVEQVVLGLADEHGIAVSTNVLAAREARLLLPSWYRRPFTLADQAAADTESGALDMLATVSGEGVHLLVCHPGYVDADVLDLSSFSVVRARDLSMTCSGRVRELLHVRDIELITYADLAAGTAARPDPTMENA